MTGPTKTKPPVPKRTRPRSVRPPLSERPASEPLEVPGPPLPLRHPWERSKSEPPASSAGTPPTDQLWADKIQVTEEVGRGAMSYVMRGTDTQLRRELAIKVAPAPKRDLPKDQLARFVEEAQVTAQLEHPNVVPVHEIGSDPEGRPFFSMKLVRGRSLESILEARREGDPQTLTEFGLRRLLDVFLQVCQAIEYAHARGVIHRDLKPANIMVGDFGEVLVMDWGVAKLAGRADHATIEGVVTTARPNLPSLGSVPPPAEVSSVRAGKQHLATQLGTVIGTPAYMSPEQAEGRPVDERSDLYSLGTILYEILCGELPFDDEDPLVLITRMLTEAPRPPSSVNPKTPLALEALALRLIEKQPERRSLSLGEIRAHVQNYIEGIERDFSRESLWSNVLWVAGALSLFAFLVWYVTGQSIAALFVLAPATVLNAIGWFLFVTALGYPLWSGFVALKRTQIEQDRFVAPGAEDLFVSGFLKHRTFAAALAPIFQLAFIVELVTLAVARLTSGGDLSPEVIGRMMKELRVGWGRALIVILIFLFGYLFLLYREVRFARRIDRYDTLVERSRWEATWPFGLIAILLLTIGLTDVLDWVLVTGVRPLPYVKHLLFRQPIDVFDVTKTFVLQGTLLMGLVFSTVLLAFPFAEVLAALRLPYQLADQASVTHRAQYFMRSLAVFRVARVNWLYGGAMISSLTALTFLSEQTEATLVERVLYVLGPALMGFVGYALTRRHVRRFTRNAPAVATMISEQVAISRLDQVRARIKLLEAAPWRYRLIELTVPVLCIVGFLLLTGSGIHQQAIRKLVVPVSTEGWLLILPYALLVPLILGGHWIQLFRLRRTVRRADAAAPSDEATVAGDGPGEAAQADRAESTG